jgi:NAD(P)-dependent dehydrogenase (short-subunit alcohol dehydrogenase family)
MQNYLDLTGKVALTTGASSGIGAATAVLLAGGLSNRLPAWRSRFWPAIDVLRLLN